jgi:anoctamin-5
VQQLDQPEHPSDSNALKLAKKRASFESKLKSRGLIVEPEMAENGTTYYVKIHAPFEVLCRKAEQISMNMPLKPTDNGPKKVSPSVFENLTNMIRLPGFISNIFDCGEPEPEDLYTCDFKRDRLHVC